MGYQQLDYVQLVFAMLEANHVRHDSHFLGMAVWSWNDRMFLGGQEYKPATLSADMQAYLGKNL
ncbi:MAG: hypothetical protein A3F11_06780 [Gammaproteobacteria bacterium RIFCSPHIGHO2_12_FULL_37_14]|nr:MAG: hypothetical protein A3F11_06780 [Gammaproteobacteria bacterium RIFCSPHIGHO2_12_FULL_37_14]